MCKVYKMCSIHGLTRIVETGLYGFLASGRYRIFATYRKDSSLQQYLTASSHHRYVIGHNSHSFPETAGICTRIHLLVPVENIEEIKLGYNCGMKIVDLKNIS